MSLVVRDSAGADLRAILAIHNHHIAHTLAIWRDATVDLDERRAWRSDRLAAGYPVLVAEEDGETIGFASYGPFRAGAGYSGAVENSIYVRDDRQRRGVARALLTALIARARADGRHVMVAAIGLPNDASVALHAAFGFAECGRLSEVGRKFGRWLDLQMMQKRL